jgi:TatD DNase family protein
LIDSHTHLFICEKPTTELLEAAAAAGVERMLNVGLDETTNAQVIAQAEANAPVFASVGRHPNDATGFDDKAQAALLELGAHPKVRAIGETGLDFYRDTAAPEDQRRAFLGQIEVAGSSSCRSSSTPATRRTRAPRSTRSSPPSMNTPTTSP